VLVVDDEVAMLLTTEAILSEAYDVTTAASGEEALRALATGRFDVVCTDYAMGRGMTGVELLEQIAPGPQLVGKVLVTGQHEVGATAGQYYVLHKPYEPQRLLEVVERALSQTLVRRRVRTGMADARRALERSGAGPERESPPAAPRGERSTRPSAPDTAGKRRS
jgi:DNA-binding NtrC family response regulator